MVNRSKVLFSILIPVYNTEDYLEACIESVLNQDFQDYEIVLVDDGSLDRSPEICDSYAKNYYNIRVIHKKNEGLFLARKTGVENANGQYLLFLDSDDTFRKDTLEILKQCIDTYRSDLILFNASIYSDYREPLLNIGFYDGENFEADRKDEIYKIICSTHQLNNLCFKCVKRDIVDLDLYSCCANISYGEDLFQSISLLDMAQRVTYINQNLYFYRQTRNSMTHLYSSKQLESIFAVFEKLVCYSSKWRKETGVDLVSLTDRYAGQECYSITKNIIGADSDFATKNLNLLLWYSSDFFQKYKKCAYLSLCGVRAVLYWLMMLRSKPINYIIHILFSLWTKFKKFG